MIQVLTFHILGFGHRYGSVSKDVKKEEDSVNELELFMTLMQALETLRKSPPLLLLK